MRNTTADRDGNTVGEGGGGGGTHTELVERKKSEKNASWLSKKSAVPGGAGWVAGLLSTSLGVGGRGVGSQLIKQKSKVLKRNEEAKNATRQRQLKLQKKIYIYVRRMARAGQEMHRKKRRLS